jgi:hypothetical protein
LLVTESELANDVGRGGFSRDRNRRRKRCRDEAGSEAAIGSRCRRARPVTRPRERERRPDDPVDSGGAIRFQPSVVNRWTDLPRRKINPWCYP